MKKIKILIAIMLVFSILPVSFGYAQEYAEEAETEIAINQTENYKKLRAFGVISEDDELDSSDTITRATFMYYVMKCCLGSDSYSEIIADIPFSDVSSGTIGAREIVLANRFGIISGSGGSKFRPNDNITVNEAAKVFISILGYGEIAESSGGFANGYMALANKLGIFKGCKSISNGYMTANDFLKSLMNTLKTEVLDIEAIARHYDGFIKTYNTIKDRTLLEYVFGIYVGEGVVKSNEYTSINGLSTLDKNQVEINGEIYFDTSEDAADLIGYNTEFYYRFDENKIKLEIVYIAPKNNNIIDVNSDYIVKGAVTSTYFKYYKDESKKKTADVKIKKSATLIYNGGQKKLTSGNLCPENGNVTLIDYDRDNNYDVVIVMNYRTIMVEAASPSTYTVSDALGGTSIVLEPDNKDYDALIYKNGARADFASIEVGNVISYAESSGNSKNVKYVKISTDTVEGKLDSIGDDTVSIDGEEYSFIASMKNSLFLGDTGIFYLDFNGKIVAKKLSKDVVYGYLNILDKSSFSKICAEIFTENNRWVELEFKKNIKYNGAKKSAVDVYDILTGMTDYRQLITYTVDEEGKINMLSIAENFGQYTPEEEYAIEHNIFRVYDKISSTKYRSGFKSLENLMVISSDAKIFVVPDQSEKDASKEDFRIITRGEFSAGEELTNVIPYDLDKARRANALVLVGYQKKINPNSSFMIVDDIVYARNTADDFVKSVRGYYKNTLVTIPAVNDSIVSAFPEELSAGDIIQVSLNENGDINGIELKFNFSKNLGQEILENGRYHTSTFLGSKIEYVAPEADTVITHDINDGNGRYIMGVNNNTLINVYDTVEKTVKQGTIADLKKGNSFFARIADYVANEIVVYH